MRMGAFPRRSLRVSQETALPHRRRKDAAPHPRGQTRQTCEQGERARQPQNLRNSAQPPFPLSLPAMGLNLVSIFEGPACGLEMGVKAMWHPGSWQPV